MKKNDKNKKKRGIGIRLYAFVALVLALMIAACIFLLVFRAQNVRITGNEHCEEQTIRKWVMQDVPFENTLLALWKNKYGQSELPAMTEGVDLSLEAPWTLKVKVREKEIIGYVEQNDEYVYFDSEGYVLEVSEELYVNVFPVSGLGDVTAKKGERLEAEDEEIFGEISEICTALKEQKLNPSVIQVKDGELFLQFHNIVVELGEDGLAEKIAQLPDVLDQLKGESGTLHLEKYSASSKTIWFKKKGGSQTSEIEGTTPVND